MKDRIEKILRLEQISSSRFADEIGVQRSSISHLFSGRNKPSLELIQKILQRYPNLSTEWLLTGKGEMYKKLNQPSLFVEPILSEPNQITKPTIINNEESIVTNNENEVSSENISETKNSIKTIVKIITLYSDKTFSEYFLSTD
jgi:transcriptional regulator with XRE-family HTH domain